MLLALASKPEELEVVLISLTFGNVDVQKYVNARSEPCLRRTCDAVKLT